MTEAGRAQGGGSLEAASTSGGGGCLSSAQMERLFEDPDGGVGGRPSPTSSEFQRIAMAHGITAERVRELLETWWSELPAAARPQVRERLTSTDPVVHLGAFWELYVHASLQHLFGAVIVDVGEDHLDRRQPDFALTDKDDGVRVEATAIAGEDFVERGERPRAQQFYEVLERSSNRDFLLHVELQAVGPNTPGRRLLGGIERWLDSLDWESELARKQAGEPAAGHDFEREGWHFRIDASPWLPDLRGRRDLGLIGSRVEGFDEGGGLRAMDGASRIRRALRQKARHGYEIGGRPFVIAALCAGGLVDDEDVAQALLGEIRHRLGGPSNYVGGGLWLGEDLRPRNRDVTAVLVATDLRPSNIAVVEPTLWTNPWARRPLSSGFLPWRQMALATDGRSEERPATRTPAEVFGLDPAWPRSA
jgi:hypothetical protein